MIFFPRKEICFTAERRSVTEYELIRSRRKTLSLELKGSRLLVRAPLREPKSRIDRFVTEHEDWIRKHLAAAEAREAAAAAAGKLSEEELKTLTAQARGVFAARSAHFAPLVGVTYGRISVRRQHTKWGSCSAKGDLSFNALLLLAPPEVLDSVVLHELCHRRFMDHSAGFYALLGRVCPDHAACRRWLKENGPLLLARLP